MAAGLFETQDIAAPQMGFSAPQAVAPVNNGNVAAAVGQGLTQLLGAGLNMYAKGQQKEQAAKQNSAVSAYAQTITKLNAAVEQGSITQAEAQRRQRAMFNQSVANFPGMTDDFVKLNTSLAGSAGLGTTLAEGTAVDQQIKADTKSATAAGFISPGMAQEQQEKGLALYRQQQQQLNAMEFHSKQLALQNQQLSLVEKKESIANQRVQRANASAELQIKRNTLGVQQAVADVTNTYVQKTLGDVDTIRQALANKQITPEQALQQTQMLRNQYYSVTQSARGVAKGSFVDDVSSPLFKVLDAADGEFSGKVSNDVAKNQLEHAQTVAALPLMADPKLAMIAAQSKIFNGIFNPTVLSNFGQDVVKVIQKNTRQGMPANPVSDDPDEADAHNSYTNGLKEAIKTFSGKNPAMPDQKGLQGELETNLNQVLKGVGTMGASVDSPTQFNNVMKFFADPSFLEFQQKGGKIDPALAQNAKTVIQENYQSQLIPAIRTEWEQNKTVTGTSVGAGGFPAMGAGIGGGTSTQVDTPNAVEYRWTGKSLQFVPAKGLERNRSALAKAKELNQKVSPLVQRLVMADAHMEGNTDYNKYFKELESSIFGETRGTGNGE